MNDDEEPDLATLSDPEMLAYLADDARKWAKAFVRFHGGDVELMTTWFANAIETADDHRRARMLKEYRVSRTRTDGASDPKTFT
jgi:hypothetical protein